MTKRKKQAKIRIDKPQGISIEEYNQTRPKRQPNIAQMITADYITAKLERGLQAFIVAGAEILQSDYGFTPEQAKEWADKSVELGSKYMKGASVPNEVQP